MEHLPSDPFVLFSYVNTQLRDHYPSREEFCEAMDVDAKEIEAKLKAAGFEYNQEQNKFW